MTQTSTVEALNDRFQQATSPSAGLAILESASLAVLRALADLNHIEAACCGGPRHGLMADRFGDDWYAQVKASRAQPTRGTWKTHGRPERFRFFGRGQAPANTGGLLVEIRRGKVSGAYNGEVVVIDAEGQLTDRVISIGGTAMKFWACPA